MTATRLNKGKQTGMLVTTLGNWNLLQTGDDRYKLAAIEPTHGKANYAFGTRDYRISTHAGLDVTKLRDDHPDLFQAVNDHFQSLLPKTPEKEEEADPYGDLALNRRRPLTPDQNWRRGLLQMRRIEFERVAVNAETVWEAGVRMLWAGVYKSKIADSELQKALAWIKQRKGEVDLIALLDLEKDYYSGKLGAKPMSELETRLDQLAGSNDYENLEEDNGRELGNQILDSAEGHIEAVCGTNSDGNTAGRTASDAQPDKEPDPFAAFA